MSKQRTEKSWWRIIGDFAYPWASLVLVWQFGLHLAVLFTVASLPTPPNQA